MKKEIIHYFDDPSEDHSSPDRQYPMLTVIDWYHEQEYKIH